MINWPELVAEVAEDVRKGAALADAVAEIAEFYSAPDDMLMARVHKAYPNGVTPPLPSAEVMEQRRKEERAAEYVKAERDAQAIVEFFNTNPGLMLEVRRNITRYTGKKSCTMTTARRIGERLLEAQA